MPRLPNFTSRLILVLFVALLVGSLGTAVYAQDNTAATGTCVPTQPPGWVVYIIQDGDTLSEIAERSGSTVQELQQANCIENPRRIVAGTRLYVPREPLPNPAQHFLRRCLNAGFTVQQCRRIYNALNGDEHSFAERCQNAGFTPQECRRIYNLLHDDPDVAERCRNAGLSIDECRRRANANQDNDRDAQNRNRNQDDAPQRQAETTTLQTERPNRGG